MAGIGTGRPDNSHPHSLSNTRALRRPSTSPPTPGPPPPSSLVFLYDSPPIPGDPDYQGEDLDLFVPVRNNRRGRATENTGLGTEIDTERDTTATRTTTTTATTTATTALLPAAAAAAVGNRNYYSDISSSSTAQPPLPLQTQDESPFPQLSFLPSLPSLQRPRSVGGNRNGIHTPVYNESAATSARTSYTRVDITAMEPSVEESLGQAGRVQGGEGGEGAGGGEASSSPPATTSTNNPNATTTTTTTTSEQAQEPEQEITHLNANTQQQQPTPSTPIPQTPQVALCFLLISGKRRVMQFEPETTVGRVKELVWNAWPTDWQDERPPTPWHLRLLYLGKILQDDDMLKGLSFPIHTPPSQSDAQTQPQPQDPPPPPTIVHLSIRPFGPGAPTPDDEIKKKRKSIRVPRWGSTVSTGNEGGRDTPLDGAEGGAASGDVGGRGSSACCGCVVS